VIAVLTAGDCRLDARHACPVHIPFSPSGFMIRD
jgi:hypothetical protein